MLSLHKTIGHVILLLVCLSFGAPRAMGIIISLDFTHDTYITTNATAQAALTAAASDVSAAITTSLTAITGADDPITGNDGSTNVTVDWGFSYTNPTTNLSETYDPPTIAADTVTIFAGGRNITGSTLGIGGPNSAGIGLGASGFGSEVIAAMADMESQSNTIHPRGGGPTMGNFVGSRTLQGTTAFYDLDFGSSLGSITFDLDSDNNGAQDNAAQLAAYWHFDHTTAVAAGKNDFYSVAVHELLHAVGIGTADSWDDLASGTTWSGPVAVALNGGSGVGLLHTDSSHIVQSLMSPRVSDGVLQEVVMDPNITVGTRKELTLMDMAFLQDINWQTVTIPEPGGFIVVLLGVMGIAPRRPMRSSHS